jgi:hypothetical protein
MNKADEELRETIKKLWPFQSKKMLNLLVAPPEGKRGNEVLITHDYQGRRSSDVRGVHGPLSEVAHPCH